MSEKFACLEFGRKCRQGNQQQMFLKYRNQGKPTEINTLFNKVGLAKRIACIKYAHNNVLCTNGYSNVFAQRKFLNI